MRKLMRPRNRPCPACPYRLDAPSGLWDESEYDKLPAYDGDTGEQAMAGATGVFACHSSPEHVCAGWAGCHDMDENFAIRLHHRDVDVAAVRAYRSPVPLFGSGAEAAEHGKRDLEHPDERTQRKAAQLIKVIGRRK